MLFAVQIHIGWANAKIEKLSCKYAQIGYFIFGFSL